MQPISELSIDTHSAYEAAAVIVGQTRLNGEGTGRCAPLWHSWVNGGTRPFIDDSESFMVGKRRRRVCIWGKCERNGMKNEGNGRQDCTVDDGRYWH